MKKLYRLRKTNDGVIKEELAVLETGKDWASVQPNQVIGYDADGNALVPIKDITLDTVNVTEEIRVLGLTLLDDDVIVGQGLTIRGDLIVDGVSYVTSEESLDTTSDYVVLRQSNTSGLGASEKAGFVVHNYSGGKNAALTVDREGTFRVSDNTQENNTGYSNISSYDGEHYDGLTQTTPIALKHGAIVSQDIDEMEEVVWYNNRYYKYDNVHWFEVYLDSNKLAIDISSPITDQTTIDALELLDKKPLRYARNLVIMSISDTQVVVTDEKDVFHVDEYDFNEDMSIADVTGYTLEGTPYEFADVQFVCYQDEVYRVNADATGIYVDKYYPVIGVDLENKTIDEDSAVTDTDTVDALEELTPTSGYAYHMVLRETIINNQPILTRAEADDLKDGQLLVWDAQSKKAVAFKEPTKKNQTIVSGKDVNDEWVYNWGAGAGSGGAVAHFATVAEWEAARLIPEGEDGYLAPNSLIIIDSEVDYLTGEEQNA